MFEVIGIALRNRFKRNGFGKKKKIKIRLTAV